MAAEVLRRADGECGELVLRRGEFASEDSTFEGSAFEDPPFEIIADGMFLMDTRNGESERLMVTAAANLVPRRSRVLIGGLGVGFALRAALDDANAEEVVVVEREPAVVDWNRAGPLRAVHGDALADQRVRVATADLHTWLRDNPTRFDVLCLDVDNGPEWTVTESNNALYETAGLDLLASRLNPGGVLAVWSAGNSECFTSALRGRFDEVRILEVPVPRGEPDIVWLAHG